MAGGRRPLLRGHAAGTVRGNHDPGVHSRAPDAKEVEQEEIQHFIESQKIFVEREKERIAQENEYIKAYLARRDAWVAEQEKIISERRVLKSEGVQILGKTRSSTC